MTVDHVYRARERIERDKTMEVITSLPLHSKLSLLSIYILTLKGVIPIKSGTAYLKYKELCSSLSIRPLSSRHFLNLVKELAILGIIDKRVENFGRRGGRTTIIKLSLPLAEVGRILKEDEITAEILLSEI